MLMTKNSTNHHFRVCVECVYVWVYVYECWGWGTGGNHGRDLEPDKEFSPHPRIMNFSLLPPRNTLSPSHLLLLDSNSVH